MFRWNGNYDDHEQVRPFLADYSKLRQSGVSYNADFKGRISGIADSPDENRAIYVLSCLWRIEQEREQIRAAIEDGYEVINSASPSVRQRFSHIMVYRPGYYSGGTGLISEYCDARLVFDVDGRPAFVLPKGKHTHGHSAAGAQILVKG